MRKSDGTVLHAVAALRAGQPVVLIDDSGPECVGAVTAAGEHTTPEVVAFSVRHGSGFLTVAVTGADADRFGLVPMDPAAAPGSRGYTVSVDALGGGTGISAEDRSLTVRTLADPAGSCLDLSRPGHVVPIRVADDGTASHRALPEVAVGLVTAAGLRPVAALTALVGDLAPGGLPGRDGLEAFAAEHDLCAVTVDEVVSFLATPRVVALRGSTLRTDRHEVRVQAYRDVRGGPVHSATMWGELPEHGAAVHIHVDCPQEHLLGGVLCGCRSRRDAAIRALEWSGSGALVRVAVRAPEDAIATWCAAGADPDRAAHVATAAAIVAELGLVSVTAVEIGDDLVGALWDHGVRVGPRDRAPRSVVRAPGAAAGADTLATVIGTVVHGDKRGRELGFPTANIGIEVDRCRLPDGVYGGLARVVGDAGPSDFVPAAISVGSNPTFPGTDQRFEVHLLDFTGDLYGRRVEVLPLTFVRPTLPFESVEALVVQIESDIREIRRLAMVPPAVAARTHSSN
ncbi:hypothetical protein GIS00_24565 [Nakamurella sp. YIM 132087]|uniref:Riboflavin kinase domain-containing protein n=1 Tax=Nakamurella alba TaxID=2665158 RepID=A0A7K1FWC9_9ACTN|nr:3,4-dihydroxy-2-butanone-4-phosphate synthase [Nakamurella alba]MTD17114.1 hypothetical protein [Nakamurella alba]